MLIQAHRDEDRCSIITCREPSVERIVHPHHGEPMVVCSMHLTNIEQAFGPVVRLED
jgi:cytosine/adenosine deaminase-related metal-dependent hydrolase